MPNSVIFFILSPTDNLCAGQNDIILKSPEVSCSEINLPKS